MIFSKSAYLEALFLLIGEGSRRSKDLVKEFLEYAAKSNVRKEITTPDDSLIDVYKALITTVISENITQDNTTASKILSLKIKSIDVFRDYPVERDMLLDILASEESISATQIDEYLKRIRNLIIHAQIEETNRKIFSANHRVSETVDPEQQEIEILKLKDLLTNSLKTIEDKQSSVEKKASESYVSFSDKDSIRRAMDLYIERSVTGVIKTGLQGLNRALGSRGGIGRGESAVFPASSHNYKSGMLVSFLIWAATLNIFTVLPGKKALIYFVSLENEVHQNLMQVFKALYNRVENKKVDLDEMSSEFIVDWIHTYFAKFNVEVIIDRYQPHEFSFGRFIKRFNSFCELEFELVLFDLDYMSESRGIDPGDTISSQGTIQLIRENYSKFANHAKACGYALTTGHQLTKRAEELASQYRNGVVKKFNPSLMADSSDVHRIVDILVFLQLETNLDGHKFLTLFLKKNRGCTDTAEKDKYCAYAFSEFGIVDDYGGPPQWVTDIDAWDITGGVREENIAEAALF